MIFTESTIKISNNVSKMDSTIVLYRGDKNVEIRFTILQSPFKYSNTVATNVIESTNASYGQLVIKTPNDKPPIFSEVSATKEGTVLFTITKEMIDEIEEVGVYTFQIRLMDENKQSRVTIPPVENGIEIKEPIAIEDDNTTNVVGLAKANYAVATLSDVDTPTFDDNGKYIKTNWNDGDIITNASLNKIEDGIYTTNENVTATKKYVDDKVTVKILPVDYDKNCATNVADLEPHSIYMSPNDAKFLYLGYEKLSGDFSGFFVSGNPHGKFIYTGAKDDTKIEVMLEGICYTAYFKTDTVDAHTEKTVFYLTKNNNKEFTPTTDYEPATKKYVDDNTPIKSLPVNPTTKTGAVVDVNNITVSGCYALPKRSDGAHWTNLMMRAMINDGSGKGKSLLLSGYQNYVFHVNVESKKIYCDNLRIVYNIGTTADTTDIRTEPYFLPTTNTKEYTPTNDYNPATKKYVDDIKTGIDGIKADLGTDELTTTAKDLKGAVNELNTQYKDIEKKTKDIISTDDINMVKVKERLFDFNLENRQYIFVGDSLRAANGRWTFKKMVYKLAKCGIAPCLIGKSGLKAEHFSKTSNIQDTFFPTTDDVIRTIKGTGAACVVDICLGTNDLSKTESEIITYLKTIISNILTAKPDTLFILTTPHRYMTNAVTDMEASSEKIYAVIKQVVNDLGNVAFCDVQSNVFKKGEDITSYMIDNIHPNKVGQYKIGEYKIKQLFNEVDSSIYDIDFKEQIFTNSNGTITTIKYAIDYNDPDNTAIYLVKDYENKWRFAKIKDSHWVYLSELISDEGLQPLMPNFNVTDSLYGIVETENIQELIDDNPTNGNIKLGAINSTICNKITQSVLQTPTTVEGFLSQIKYWDIKGTFDPTDVKAKDLAEVSLKVGFYKTAGDDPTEVYLKRSAENEFLLAFADGNAIGKTMYIDKDGIYDVKPITWDVIRVTGKLKVKNVEKLKEVIAIGEHVKIINAQQYSPIIQKSIVELLDY